jgi:hypothetical protein
VKASVDRLLHRATRAERRRVLAWILAGALVAAGTGVVSSPPTAIVIGTVAALLGLWSVRQTAGLMLARHDFNRASTPPRRAYVVLLHDPNPRAVRPLLAIWSDRPPAGERLPKPESVWRCDDELLELESMPRDVRVHEAWVDTGPRSWSKPRWVRADAGIAVPHRRSLFGRWYFSMTTRADRPGNPAPLTLEDPHAAVPGVTGDEPLELGGSLAGSTAGRLAFLAVVAAVIVLID